MDGVHGGAARCSLQRLCGGSRAVATRWIRVGCRGPTCDEGSDRVRGEESVRRLEVPHDDPGAAGHRDGVECEAEELRMCLDLNFFFILILSFTIYRLCNY